jgi:phytoene dehydrogenase-like protein
MIRSAMAPQTNYDVIIIGAGMSGLAAGIRLAYYNKKVCVLDRHAMPGGLNSFYRLQGRDFDVGLHAMTNHVARDVRGAPLNKLLRQLRIKYDEFALCPQRESDIRFPGVTLRFNNDFALFESEIRAKFPAQIDAFQRLVRHICNHNDVDLNAQPISARRILREHLSDDLLIEMLFCPLMFYGSANEDDMEFGQFAIMFKSIFREGFARPRSGVRQIISTLLKKYKACGGELRMKTGVARLRIKDGRVNAVELDDGNLLTAPIVLSSAGAVETLQMCSDTGAAQLAELRRDEGRMTYMESISVLDTLPEKIDFGQTITFFNNSEKFRYRPSQDMADTSSGVVCCPNNFQYDSPLEEGMVRITNIANFDAWARLPEDEYQAAKRDWSRRAAAEAVKFVPDFRPHTVFVDTFTPRTIWKFTRHINGAVYGSPRKLKNGRTRVANLFICGTDQGFLGIVGALLSGISMANLHVLQGAPAEQGFF